VLQKFQIQNRNIVKSKKNTTEIISEKEKSETKIPQFMTLSKLDWDNNEIHAGIIKDPTAKGGLRYQVIEPVLSERDKKAFEIIKKLLITELSVSTFSEIVLLILFDLIIFLFGMCNFCNTDNLSFNIFSLNFRLT